MADRKLAGRALILRFGFRPTLLLGLGAIVAGSVPFVSATEEIALPWIALFLMVQGFGLGLTTLAGTIAAQSSVEWRQRGVATSIVMLARSLGAAVTVTVLGSLLASQFSRIASGLDLGAGNVREAAALLEPGGARRHRSHDAVVASIRPGASPRARFLGHRDPVGGRFSRRSGLPPHQG